MPSNCPVGMPLYADYVSLRSCLICHLYVLKNLSRRTARGQQSVLKRDSLCRLCVLKVDDPTHPACPKGHIYADYMSCRYLSYADYMSSRYCPICHLYVLYDRAALFNIRRSPEIRREPSCKSFGYLLKSHNMPTICPEGIFRMSSIRHPASERPEVG